MSTNNTDEFWSWNGTSLHQQQWSVATIGGSRFGVPTLRGQDYEVPFRAGQSWRAKYPNSRTMTLVMWNAGIDAATGQPAADQRLAWNDNWATLRQMFWSRGLNGSQQGTLTRQWFVTQGGTPTMVSADALAEVAGTMEPTMTGRTRADFSVDLLLSDPYFYGAQQTGPLAINNATAITNLGDGIVGEGFGGVFTAAFTGPLTNPLLTNSTLGVSVALGLALPANYTVTLDMVAFTATDSLSASQLSYVTHSGSRMWMALKPGSNTLTLTSGNSTDTGTVLLTWQPPYL